MDPPQASRQPTTSQHKPGGSCVCDGSSDFNFSRSMSIITLSLACKVESCPRHFPDKSQMEAHMREAHGLEPFRCWAGCRDAYFCSRAAIDDHNSEKHPNVTRWECYYCPQRTFKSYNTLYLHTRREHEAGVFKCTWAAHANTFTYRQEAIEHIEQTHLPDACQPRDTKVTTLVPQKMISLASVPSPKAVNGATQNVPAANIQTVKNTVSDSEENCKSKSGVVSSGEIITNNNSEENDHNC